MKARFVKERNPLDSLGVGRIEERRKEKILNSIKDIVADYKLDEKTIKDQNKDREGVIEIEFKGNNYIFYIGWLTKTQEYYYGVETKDTRNQEGQRSDNFEDAVETTRRWVRKYGDPKAI